MKYATFHMVTALLAIGLMSGANLAQAQAGSLDTTFGTGGTVTTSFADGVAGVGAFEQSNGDIVAVAQVNLVNNVGTGIGLVRYTSAGELDTTFGTNGITVSTFAGIAFDPFGFAVQKSGGILIGGVATTKSGLNKFGLARYTSNGVLDTTFGTNGLVITKVGTRSDAPSALLLQPNGKIVMGGFEVAEGNIPGMMSLVRYNANGTLDTTFGKGGISLASVTFLGPETLALLSNGDYLAVGQNANGNTGIVAEFSSKGVLLSKVTSAKVMAALSSSQGAVPNVMFQSPTVFQPNGHYVVATTSCTFHSECRGTKFAMNRFLETGKTDPAFDATVESFDPTQTTSVAQTVALQANGQIVVGGLINQDAPIVGGLVRLDSNGELDTSFGTVDSFGVCCSVTSDQTFSGLLIQTDGKIVAIGGLDGDLAVARYLAN
ncbi:MAG TPA: hypothetical protein VMQ17_13645 [Candidatus Sulfotelmatobacter sp.]|nr:hypothetical protein [Candidatus Sulfotelmatobacter sp.]